MGAVILEGGRHITVSDVRCVLRNRCDPGSGQTIRDQVGPQVGVVAPEGCLQRGVERGHAVLGVGHHQVAGGPGGQIVDHRGDVPDDGGGLGGVVGPYPDDVDPVAHRSTLISDERRQGGDRHRGRRSGIRREGEDVGQGIGQVMPQGAVDPRQGTVHVQPRRGHVAGAPAGGRADRRQADGGGRTGRDLIAGQGDQGLKPSLSGSDLCRSVCPLPSVVDCDPQGGGQGLRPGRTGLDIAGGLGVGQGVPPAGDVRDDWHRAGDGVGSGHLHGRYVMVEGLGGGQQPLGVGTTQEQPGLPGEVLLDAADGDLLGGDDHLDNVPGQRAGDGGDRHPVTGQGGGAGGVDVEPCRGGRITEGGDGVAVGAGG